MKFLLRHNEDLNLSYSFATKLSFISIPLLFGKAMLILSEEDYVIVGAVGFVYGTGLNGYEDRNICQIEIAYLVKENRCTTLFVQGLLSLLDVIKAGSPNVEKVQFWVTGDRSESDRLFSKFSALPGSEQLHVNGQVCHQIQFRELDDYCRKFNKRFGKVE
ncbi:hypothetical protein D3C85_966270 [compost metagenome]